MRARGTPRRCVPSTPADDVDARVRRRGRAVEEVDELAGLDGVKVSDREVKMAEMLAESLTAEFDRAKYEDDYRVQVLDLIAKTAAGEELSSPSQWARRRGSST